MADENVVKLGFAKRVVHRENGPARIAENVAYAETCQGFAQYFGTSAFHRVLPIDTGTAPAEKLAGTEVIAPSEEEETSRAYLAMTP
jgi:hypothetical protein